MSSARYTFSVKGVPKPVTVRAGSVAEAKDVAAAKLDKSDPELRPPAGWTLSLLRMVA